jgi:multidrug efflux pump subunit AcrB
MIGFIALAGIIVRNSILLVDFIRHGASPGQSLIATLLHAGAIRFKPILLTALAAMIGAAVILTDRSSRASRSRCCSASCPRRCRRCW